MVLLFSATSPTSESGVTNQVVHEVMFSPSIPRANACAVALTRSWSVERMGILGAPV
jgi:hypothetical protein